MGNRVGRPKLQKSPSTGNSQTRQCLLDTALECFCEQSFEQVSTRDIARRANVDAAMIRYYFGSKAGLFECVIVENIDPVIQLLRQSNQQTPAEPIDLIHAYYQAFGNKPRLPRLIFQTLHQEPNQAGSHTIRQLFKELIAQLRCWLQSYASNATLRPDVSTDYMYLSIVSCMVFPLIAPPFIQQQLGVELSTEGLDKLAKHNNALILNGLFLSDTNRHLEEASNE